jgi:hypothetical protein
LQDCQFLRPQSYEKLQEKALSKIHESDAEGENMKLVSEFFYCWASKVMPLRILDNICGVMLRKEEMALSGKCCTMPGQRFSNNS